MIYSPDVKLAYEPRVFLKAFNASVQPFNFYNLIGHFSFGEVALSYYQHQDQSIIGIADGMVVFELLTAETTWCEPHRVINKLQKVAQISRHYIHSAYINIGIEQSGYIIGLTPSQSLIGPAIFNQEDKDFWENFINNHAQKIVVELSLKGKIHNRIDQISEEHWKQLLGRPKHRHDPQVMERDNFLVLRHI